MTPPDPPSPPRIGLPAEQFAAAFPFHLAVDEALTILQVGATLQRICPDVRSGIALDRVFRPIRPEGCITLEWVRQNKARFFLLEHIVNGLRLRGEFVMLPGEGRLVFVGSPWFTDASEIAARGLGFEDFAIHDPAVDLLQVIQSSNMALADAKKLAGKLTAQRAELRAANERLREQESESRKLALVAARTDNAVILTDAAGLVVWVNAGFTRLTGYRLDEVLGRKPGSVLQGPKTDAATVQRIRARMRQSEGFTEEILNYRKDGREYWVAVEVQAILDEAGRVVNYMSVESDITERRREQQRLAVQFEVASMLAESDDLPAAFRGVLQVICERLGWQVGQMWQVSDERLRLLHTWQSDSVNVAGFVAASRGRSFASGEGLPGRAWGSGTPCWIPDVTRDDNFPRSGVAAKEGLHGAFAFPVPVRGEIWGVAEFFSTRIEQPDEALLKTIATIAVQLGEFVVRRQAQGALRRSEEFFRSVFEDTHAGMAVGSLDGRFLRVNRALCEMLGYTEEELRGRSWLELLHPDDVAATRTTLEQARRGDLEQTAQEKRYLRKDGSTVWAIVRARLMRGRDGSPDLVIAQILDITERKQAERELRVEKRLLEEARQRELQTGHEIQRSLLIGELPTGIPGTELAGYALPSRGIDGDFYAFTTYRPDCFELLVGDVMGKGVPAALVGAAVRTTYHQVTTELTATSLGGSELPHPAGIVNALHGRLTPRLVELETFVTLALYRFDLARGELTFVNAGHTPGLLLRRDGAIERILGANVPIGALVDERYEEATQAIAAGDALLVYSDGITEARNVADAEFGEGRLRGFLHSLRKGEVPTRIVLQALRKRVHDFVGERAMPDDETAVLVGLRGPFGAAAASAGPGEGEETFDLPWDLAGLEPLRRRVSAAAASLGPEAASRLVLASFEAATNVVRHVAPPFPDATFCCRLRPEGGGLAVELWYVGLDFEPESDRAPNLSGTSEGGFGLYIIENAVSRVTYEQPALDICCTRLVQFAASPVPG